ncbi:MAG: hypothetical protein ACPGWR_03245 [Ardenticatenaceae bacterium]
MSNNVWSLKNVDYSEKGKQFEVVVEGQVKQQTTIYTALDYAGNKWYYTEEGHSYILDSRRRRGSHWFVERYLSKIPVIVRNPIIIGRDPLDKNKKFYYGLISVAEHNYQKLLFVVVMQTLPKMVVWNFYWLEQQRVPSNVIILYRTKWARRHLRGR